MNILGQEFSEVEIEEVNLAKELCEGMEVNGTPVIGFDIMVEILNGNDIKLYSKETLLTVYTQLNGYNTFWSDVSWFDNEKMIVIIDKFKKILKRSQFHN